MIVDNRPGGGGVIASQATLAAPPDGHTVCICAGSYVTITPATTANMPYDVDKDFTPIAFVAEIPLVIGARPDLPYKSLAELIAYAKANPDRINYAANTPGTFPHLATEYFSQRAGIQMHFIPYKGSSPALADLIGGRLDLVVEGVAALGGAIKGGQLRPLGVSSTRRDPTLPDVPAIAETIPGSPPSASTWCWRTPRRRSHWRPSCPMISARRWRSPRSPRSSPRPGTTSGR